MGGIEKDRPPARQFDLRRQRGGVGTAGDHPPVGGPDPVEGRIAQCPHQAVEPRIGRRVALGQGHLADDGMGDQLEPVVMQRLEQRQLAPAEPGLALGAGQGAGGAVEGRRAQRLDRRAHLARAPVQRVDAGQVSFADQTIGWILPFAVGGAP